MLFKPAIRIGAFRTIAVIGLLAFGVSALSATASPPLTLGDLVRAGKRESVLAAITSPDVDVNEKAPDGSTALMWATFNVDRELVRVKMQQPTSMSKIPPDKLRAWCETLARTECRCHRPKSGRMRETSAGF